jgi:heme/copper-type cytochrome/quinol oxidase subunit 4
VHICAIDDVPTHGQGQRQSRRPEDSRQRGTDVYLGKAESHHCNLRLFASHTWSLLLLLLLLLLMMTFSAPNNVHIGIVKLLCVVQSYLYGLTFLLGGFV